MNREDTTGHNLVFLVGSPRSGTTYLKNLLGCHSLIRTGRESHLFNSYIGPLLTNWSRHKKFDLKGYGSRGLPSYLDQVTYLGLVKRFTISLLENMVPNLKGREIFLEKTPAHAFEIRRIIQLFPKTRFIHIMRDGRDVVASLVAASKYSNKQWGAPNARQAAKMWRSHTESIINAKSKLQPQQFHEIRYEELIASPEAELKKVSNFLDIHWDDRDILEALESNRLEKAETFVRKGKPGSWKSDLTLIDKFWVWYVARRTMSRVGYS